MVRRDNDDFARRVDLFQVGNDKGLCHVIRLQLGFAGFAWLEWPEASQ